MKKNFVVHIIISLFIIVVLACGWYQSCTRNSESSVTIPSAPDTIIRDTIIYDTIFKDTIIYKEKIILDTIYIETYGDSVVSLPIIQKHYQEKDTYDIWISGIEPLRLDSVRVYQKTELSLQTVYKDKIVYKEKESRPLEFYISCGFYSFSDAFVPKIGISTKIGEKWLVSVNLGFNKDIYDIGINYKIF